MKIDYIPLSYNVERKIRRYVSRSRYFGDPLKYNAHKFGICKYIASSIIIAYTKDKIMYNYRNLLLKKNLVEQFERHKSIMHLSRKYDNSPMTIMRVILKRKYDMLKHPSKYLQGYYLEQFNIANDNDIYATTNQDEQLRKSLEYEKHVKNILDKNGVSYLTQDELQEKGYKLTPDFLIKGDFKIDGKQIKWIDAKNFFGAYSFFNRKRLKKQAKKYNNYFGKYGAFAFSMGFSEKLNIDNTLLLKIDKYIT